MHLPTIRAKRQIQARLDRPLPPARELAIGWLRDKLTEGEAGLDPYDRTVLIVEADANERVWARTVIEVTGLFLTEYKGEFRCIVETDVYDRLGLSADGAPLMDSPISPTYAPTALMDAVFGSLEPRPALTLLESADDKVVH